MANVKFSYYTGCRERLLSRDYNGLFSFLRENGYTAIEPLEFELANEKIFSSYDEAVALRSLLDENGIAVSCYSVCVDVFADPASSREFLLTQAKIAAALGSPYLHHTIYPPFVNVPDMPTYDEALQGVLPTLCDVIRYASKLGVTVLYEPQGFVFNGKSLASLIKHLHTVEGCEDVGVCFDFGNSAFVDCEPTDLLNELFPFVRHVHLKDYKYVDESINADKYRTKGGKAMVEVLFGEGDMNVERLISVLREKGYNGYCSTEVIPIVPKIDHDVAGNLAVEFIRKNKII